MVRVISDLIPSEKVNKLGHEGFNMTFIGSESSGVSKFTIKTLLKQWILKESENWWIRTPRTEIDKTVYPGTIAKFYNFIHYKD